MRRRRRRRRKRCGRWLDDGSGGGRVMEVGIYDGIVKSRNRLILSFWNANPIRFRSRRLAIE